MGLLSFVGRVLFAAAFFISAFQESAEFRSGSAPGSGPAAKFLEPKFYRFVKQVSTNAGMAGPSLRTKERLSIPLKKKKKQPVDRSPFVASRRERRERRLEEEGGRPPASQIMGLLSFVGRVLFASAFLISAFQESAEFRSRSGPGRGPAAKFLEPKFYLFVKQVSTNTGMTVPHVDIKTVMVTTMYIRAFGSVMFILYSSFGAFLLLVYLAFITPIVYDFYNYEMKSPQFVQLFIQFSQNLALCGALFFMGMKSSIPKRYRRRPKTKTA